MYTSFFGLHEKPFSITPDPRYLFMSERHTEALAHLIYGVKEGGGFIQLTGEVGTGKTTLVRTLLQQLPDTADVALVLNPQLSSVEFLAAICEELHVPLPSARDSIKALTDALNLFLLQNHSRGRRTILIVDEAQNLDRDVLEQVRLLTNLETAKQKLLQIILIGQPELREMLAGNDLRQLAQRITGRYHLEPLSREETAAYLEHRIKVAGGVGRLFADAARREIYRLSGGIPRMVNVIADRALLGAFTAEAHQVTPEIVRRAAAEVYGRTSGGAAWVPLAGAAALAVIAVTLGMWLAGSLDGGDAAATAASDVAIAPAASAVSAAGPIVSAQPASRLSVLLAELPNGTDAESAFGTLFGLWGVAYSPGPPGACQQAEITRLHCVYRQGTLQDIAALNTPVIMTLRDHQQVEYNVVLAGLSGNTALIDIAGREYRVSATELEQFWSGEYLLLWQPQTAGVKSFFPGMRDPDVKWLRASLAAIQGEPVTPMDSDFYDTALEERVKAYQRDRHLTANGLVGHETQVAIIADLPATDTPRLTRVN
jgi:general secretion pathway protein A